MAEDVEPPRDSGFAAFADGLFRAANRGLLLDVLVFVLNLAAMAALSRLFLATIEGAAADDSAAMGVLLAVAVALFVLAPIGATLKRWHFHQRRAEKAPNLDDSVAGGCLFNPILYFCLTAVIFATINAFVLQHFYGKQEPPGGVFVGSILGGIALMILHTWLAYRYFSPPASPPRSAFLRSRVSGLIGDGCLFLNMILFQLLWNMLTISAWPRPSGALDFGLRFLLLVFLALLIYFPPRMFYLAEDIGKRRTWAMILLANAPVLVRVLWGAEAGW